MSRIAPIVGGLRTTGIDMTYYINPIERDFHNESNAEPDSFNPTKLHQPLILDTTVVDKYGIQVLTDCTGTNAIRFSLPSINNS